MKSDDSILVLLVAGLAGFGLVQFYSRLSALEAALFLLIVGSILFLVLIFSWDYFSKFGKERRKRLEQIRELPESLIKKANDSILMGVDQELKLSIYLPDSLRSRHIHILGATGSGKTESVVLNFLKQDVSRNLGSIILDAKGDASFIWELQSWVPKEKLRIFDLGSEESLAYDPLEAGLPLESSQRLFSSLSWSEEYYKSKALAALQRIF